MEAGLFTSLKSLSNRYTQCRTWTQAEAERALLAQRRSGDGQPGHCRALGCRAASADVEL